MVDHDWKKYLSPHGQSKQACEYVIRKFDNSKMYAEHLLVNRWVECSKLCLQEILRGDNEYGET